jgi:hypothetical protein
MYNKSGGKRKLASDQNTINIEYPDMGFIIEEELATVQSVKSQ